MTTGIGPYVTPDATPLNISTTPNTLEIELTISMQSVDIGGGVMANAETINGEIPGPTLRLTLGDTVIVRLINDLPHPTGIHWHGIELQNAADGTPVTQDGVAVGPFVAPVPLSPTGGTYLYKFKVTRPGLFWYHPHHFHSTNRVFRGTYGMIIVTDPDETTLVEGDPTAVANVLPPVANTLPLVLGDITVCKAGTALDPNDTATYVAPSTPALPADAEWLSSETSQTGPTPLSLCEIAPAGEAMQEDGSPALANYAAGDVPNIQRAGGGRTVEGQTVLTNGVNVGGREGTPTMEDGAAGPGAVAALTYGVQSGQGLRLQIVNCAHLRYFRLILTTQNGTRVPLVRVGGEGGLLDHAILEGDDDAEVGVFKFKYDRGEILLPPATRADIVAAIPPGEGIGSVLTLWTRDFQRTGGNNPGNWAQLPTVPVMHLEITGTAPATYMIDGGVGGVGGTELRALPAFPGGTVTELAAPAPGAGLLDPSTFAFVPQKDGQTADIQNIKLTASGAAAGIDGEEGSFSGVSPYTDVPKLDSTRYVEQGELLNLIVTNTTGAHHPFHLHGFSFQPKELTRPGSETFTWNDNEFRDVVDIPSNYQLESRVLIEDHALADGTTLGGALGRWLFHCHIFFHAHGGMISELIVTDAVGNEKPNVDVGGSWAYAPNGGTATRQGTFFHRDLNTVTLTATLEDGTPIGVLTYPPGVSAGDWSWELDTATEATADGIYFVYITATDTGSRRDQAVFRLQIGGDDEGSDNGDPHIRTVGGTKYDFQAVGEFTLLRDREGLEIQTRQTPVQTANPITDSYSGLTSSVSLNTAVAARVGSHRIAYQPGREPGQLEFFVDGKPARLTPEGIDLGEHRVSGFDVDGIMGLRVDYAHHAVLTATPLFWTSHNLWYMNISVSHTQADKGLMGRILDSSWLPSLPSGATVGPMPKTLHERYITLYRTFANAWRVTDATSLFVYGPETSTATFTDEDWPAETPPSKLKPQFEIPGAPPPVNIPVEEAEQICQAVTISDLHADCVFDVATTGDETFAKGYLLAQDLRRHGSTVQITGDRKRTSLGEPLVVTAMVLPVTSGGPTPTGQVTFLVDGVEASAPITLDGKGRARLTLDRLDVGAHKIRAAYTSDGGENGYHASSSPNLLHTVEKGTGGPNGSSADSPHRIWIWIILLLILIVFAALALVY